MAVTPAQILALAEKLAADSEGCEAHVRSAVSRAYYAAFLAVADEITPYLDSQTIRLNGEGTHSQLIGQITAYASTARVIRPGYQEAAYISKTLAKMKLKRVEADYRIDVDLDKDESHKAIDRATRVLESVEKFKARLERANAAGS
ncbi:hypothetical protein [Paenacidovorax monticola]|uniref:HEPN domain-containing protein n=1 Tax=Paenacidovorax monticola TaxID=1926868 RepID=A0A7H0HG03_9BURK|nr:hypothetical protein [Paenacidovorax monticola]QNP59469.1 hypothetical protein H9L24_00020 [Paenacidovorax monticola]